MNKQRQRLWLVIQFRYFIQAESTLWRAKGKVSSGKFNPMAQPQSGQTVQGQFN